MKGIPCPAPGQRAREPAKRPGAAWAIQEIFTMPPGPPARGQAGDTGRDMTVLPPGTKAMNSSEACSPGGTTCAATFR